MKKQLRTLLKLAVIGALAFAFPKVMAVLFVCGIYDVSRNRALTLDTLRRYFLGNGVLTWLLSPFNVFLDILALPFVNKGVYRIEDLPPAYQTEIRHLIDSAYAANLVELLETRTRDEARSMVFFKWYGANVDTIVDIPAFRAPYRFIQTIGVSVFNKKQSTSKHFGPFRPTLRLLYNLNDMKDRSAYIEVGDTTQFWQDQKLFIFDDTLQHQSFNESDAVRYCLFVDMVRPAGWRSPLVGIVTLIRYLLRSVNFIFYRNWKVIEK